MSNIKYIGETSQRKAKVERHYTITAERSPEGTTLPQGHTGGLYNLLLAKK